MELASFHGGLLAIGFWLLANQPQTAASPHADDASIEAAERRVLAEQAALEDLVTEASREDTVNRVLEMRAALIREHPQHPGRAGWLADQASDLFFVLLPIDASGLVTLFGLPSPTQRARAERVARNMNDLTEEAEIEIEAAILALESAPAGQHSVADGAPDAPAARGAPQAGDPQPVHPVIQQGEQRGKQCEGADYGKEDHDDGAKC